MFALGADAAGKAGWVGAVVGNRGFVAAHVHRTLAGLIVAAEAGLGTSLQAIGVDIPIGLVDGPVRSVDVAARAYVGPRRSSVFPAPHPTVVHLEDHAEVNRALVAMGHPRISVQGFNLFPRIREAAELAADERVFEGFPEAAFRALAGRPLTASKKTWNGLTERRALLASASPAIVIPDALGPPGAVPADDVVDAVAVAWSARRYARGEAEPHGDPSELDPVTGRRIAMWV